MDVWIFLPYLQANGGPAGEWAGKDAGFEQVAVQGP